MIYTKSFNARLTFNNSPNNVVALSSIAQNIDVILDISGSFIYTVSQGVGNDLVNCNYGDGFYSFLDTWQGYLRHRGGGWTGTWPATITLKYVKKVT